MPSVAKRKQILSMDKEPSPKKGKFIQSACSPVSSPIKGPLQDHSDTNSPSFVAKSFYGIKKSQQETRSTPKQTTPSKKVKRTTPAMATRQMTPNKSLKQSIHTSMRRQTTPTKQATPTRIIRHTTPTKKTPTSSASKVTVKPDEAPDTGNSVASRVEQLMLERIAASPVKQSLLESCSKAEFRKVFSDEYNELEAQVRRESGRQTRRSSRIVCSRDEDSDTDDYRSSDNEETFEVNNNGLDDESEDEDIENINVALRSSEEALGGDSASEDDSLAETSQPRPEVQAKDSKPCTPKLSANESGGKSSNPGSSERKFFKTRTLVDNSKLYGLVCGKGFNVKAVPKTLQNLFDRKTKKAQQKRSSSQGSSRRRVSDSPKILSGNPASENDKTCASPPSAFWFAPGFLSPEHNTDEELNAAVDATKADHGADAELSLNKSNHMTYQKTTPPKKSVLASGAATSLHPSPAESACSSRGSVNLLPPTQESEACMGASEDLFSSPANSVSDQAGDSGTKAKSVSGQAEDSRMKTTGRELEQDAGSREEGGALKEAGAGGSEQRLFPVFTRRSARLTSPAQAKRSPATKLVTASPKDPTQAQMILDAGQKKFGATQCPVCGMVYCHADPEDETAHAKFHQRLLEVLKYPGWKNDRVVQEYPEDLGRMLMVLPGDRSKSIRKKVDEVNQVMARELGFPDNTPDSFTNRQQKVFLYVLDREIAGCCVAEPIKEGFRIIPGDMDESEMSGQRPWRCSEVGEAACVGISRLWVAAGRRKTGVATKLVDCVRQWFDYGTLTPHHKLAFSDPTPDGRVFAQRYMKSNTFLVYKYNASH